MRVRPPGTKGHRKVKKVFVSICLKTNKIGALTNRSNYNFEVETIAISPSKFILSLRKSWEGACMLRMDFLSWWISWRGGKLITHGTLQNIETQMISLIMNAMLFFKHVISSLRFHYLARITDLHAWKGVLVVPVGFPGNVWPHLTDPALGQFLNVSGNAVDFLRTPSTRSYVFLVWPAWLKWLVEKLTLSGWQYCLIEGQFTS